MIVHLVEMPGRYWGCSMCYIPTLQIPLCNNTLQNLAQSGFLFIFGGYLGILIPPDSIITFSGYAHCIPIERWCIMYFILKSLFYED